MHIKSIPQFTWYRWGVGAEKFGPDSRHRCAVMLRHARTNRKMTVRVLGAGFYEIRNDDVMALIRTR